MTVHVGILPTDLLQTLHELEPRINVHGVVQDSSLPFFRLPHPRTGIPSLFLHYEVSSTDSSSKSAMLELQVVEPINSRSWFLGNEVVSDGKLLMLTPIDPAFLLIPVLQILTPSDGTAGRFRTADDAFEEAAAQFEQISSSAKTQDPCAIVHANDILKLASLDCCADALRRICDVKDIAPGIIVYRLSLPKVVEYLRGKVGQMSKAEVLETSRLLTRELAKDDLMEDGNEALLEAGRIKVACDLVGQYLSPDIKSHLMATYDLSKLGAHVKRLEEERMALERPAAKARERKKVSAGDGDSEKPKRKAPRASQGVEKLKKANINGMAKLSTFFAKKP